MSAVHARKIDPVRHWTNSSHKRVPKAYKPAVETISDSAIIQRKKSCPCDGGCPRCLPVQRKIQIGEENDYYEREADSAAERVMRMPESDLAQPNDEYETDSDEAKSLDSNENRSVRRTSIEGSETDADRQEIGELADPELTTLADPSVRRQPLADVGTDEDARAGEDLPADASYDTPCKHSANWSSR